MGHPIFQIPAQLSQSNPYVSAIMVQPPPNNIALQYAHSGAPFAPNVQHGGKFTEEDTPAAQTPLLALLYKMYQ